MYEKSYDYIILMIKEQTWIYLKKETLQWAKEKGKLWEIKWEIEWRVKNDAQNIDVKEFEKYLEEVKKYE